MFKVEKNNAKIGAYLADLIDQKYESRRAFCRAYISANGEEPTNETINNIRHRANQMHRMCHVLEWKKDKVLHE